MLSGKADEQLGLETGDFILTVKNSPSSLGFWRDENRRDVHGNLTISLKEVRPSDVFLSHNFSPSLVLRPQ